MDIIDRLNTFYTIKFTEEYEIINRGDRKYFLLNTYDDKKYLFKTYQRNTYNVTKLKESNNVAHLISKNNEAFCDYVINKDYESITEMSEDEIGTLFAINEGEFIEAENSTKEHLVNLSEIAKGFHKEGATLFNDSFTVQQVDHINGVIKRNVEKIRDEINDNGIHYLLENKFSVKFDRDLLDLNLSHIESLNERLKDVDNTILNMDMNFDNIMFRDKEISNVIFDRVYTGNAYFEIAKNISRLQVQLKQNSSDLKKIFLSEIEKPIYMQDEVMDSLICFNLIEMLYKYIRAEAYREAEERFTTLKNRLIKEKILSFV